MGLDSIEIVMEAERLFNIELPEDKVSRIYDFGAFVDCVHRECLAKGYNTSEGEVTATLRKMVSDLLGIAEHRIKRDSRFVEDLGMD